MTATDELRRMLDERGVGWRRTPHYSSESIDNETVFRGDGIEWIANDHLNGHIGLRALRYEVTPEQAIAATLGATDAKPTEAESSGTCRNVAEPDEYSDRPFTCSECGARGPMGNGTYHLASSWAMEDGTLAFADSWPVWKYCPNCGRRVVDPTADGADAEVTDD